MNELRSFLDCNHIQILSEEDTKLSYYWILNVHHLNPIYLKQMMRIIPVGVIILYYEGNAYLSLAIFKDVNNIN